MPLGGMLPRVTEVRPGSDFTLVLTFNNHEVHVFDVKPYLDRGIFKELKAPRYFNEMCIRDRVVDDRLLLAWAER